MIPVVPFALEAIHALTGGSGGGGGDFVKINKVVTSGSQSVVTFSGISASYTDLKIVCNCRGDSSTSSTIARMKLNNDTNSSNYPNPQRLFGYNGSNSGADSQSSSSSGGYIFDVSGSASVSHPLTTAVIHIPAYSSTVLEKAVMTEFYSAASSGQEVIKVGFNYIATPAAVSQIDITIGAGAFLNGSVFTLYGLG